MFQWSQSLQWFQWLKYEKKETDQFCSWYRNVSNLWNDRTSFTINTLRARE